MSGILATFSRLKNSGGGGGPPLVAARYSKSYTLFTPTTGILGYDEIGPVGSITPDTDYAGANDIRRLRQGTISSDFLEIRLASLATQKFMFEWIDLNGMNMNQNNLSIIVYPPGFVGADIDPVPGWKWGAFDNGFSLASLNYSANYAFTINAYLFDTTINFTIGTLGSAPNRSCGYNLNGTFGALNSATGDSVYVFKFNETFNRTEIWGVDDGSGNQKLVYYGRTITARYLGVDTVFTSALANGAPSDPFNDATLYTTSGNPFNLVGQNGQTRIIQIVSNAA